jgi:hypothetical protein
VQILHGLNASLVELFGFHPVQESV